MPYSTTPPPSGGHAVPAYVTLSILVAGVIGGLVIVVAVIIFCKYCVKKDKPLQRISTTEIRRQSDRERRFKPLQRYETINSDVFSEPSTGSMEGLPISPRKCYDTRSVERYSEVDEVTETTKLKTDFEKGYNDTTEDNQDIEADTKIDDKNGERQETEKVGRRVSFQLDNLPPATSTYLRKGRRYTEGDFHHLKRSRIEKVVPRQYSLCTPSNLNVNDSPSPDHGTSQFSMDEEVTRHAMVQYRPPLISLAESPSPPGEPSQTEVSVEIHYHINTDYNNRKGSLPKRRDSAKSSPLLGIGCNKRVRSHSHSLEVSTQKFYEQSRRTRSYDDIVDYDVLKITEFKGPFYNTDFDVISELGSPSGSKVRYNDTGSIEQLNDENLDRLSLYDTYEAFEMDMENDDTETLNGTQKYRELWNLRTTFEEEEECSDTIRMEDTITSPDQSPDENSNYSDRVSYNNDNNISDSGNGTERKQNHNHHSYHPIQIASNTLHPHYENRRQTYQNILTKRLQRAQQNTSAENSFDSVETVDTDGEVSDTSRHEVTTTSFETSTDNTDSTTESQNHRLMQMKADSGYKSLENQPPAVQPPGAVKRNHSAGEIEEYDSFYQEPGPSGEQFFVRSKNFDRRNGKTASKKRREYSRERQAVQIYESINEPETDSRSDQPSGDSFEETPQPSKMSVFSRLFKSQKGSTKQRSNTRDYSIDEKTDKLFREFVRYDPKFEHRSNTSSHRSPRFHRHRLHRKHTEPIYFEERRRDRLAPEMRTTSLGSDSSASSARRISPQDSIEEEDYEEVREAEELQAACIQRDMPSRQSLSVHDIPVIKLPEEEASAGF